MLNLLRQPSALLEPQTALRVWRGNRRATNLIDLVFIALTLLHRCGVWSSA
jgi:hypothetical protein